MSLQDDIFLAQQEAMKKGDKEALSILRMANAAIKNAQIEKMGALTDEDVRGVIRRQVKQLQDALLDFERGGRADLVEKSKKEIALLSSYLPAQMSAEDVRAKVEEILETLGPKETLDAGKAMGVVMKELKGKADGNVVREIVNQMLHAKT